MAIHSLKKTRHILAATALAAILGMGIATQADEQHVIVSDTADNYIGLDTNGVPHLIWSLEPNMGIGQVNFEYKKGEQCVIVMFPLPALGSWAVSNANLAVDISAGWPGGSDPFPKGVDLYGIRYNSSPTALTSDHGYNGSGSGTLIQENVFSSGNDNTPYTNVTTSATGDGALAGWLADQYTAGAVEGDFVFFRYEANADSANGWRIASFEHATQAQPTLTIDLGTEGYVPPPVTNPPPVVAVTIASSTADTFIGLDTNATPVIYWTGQPELTVGDDNFSSERGDQCALLVYQLPDLGGNPVTNARVDISLQGEFLGVTNYPVGLDLYGVRYDSSPTVLVSDYAPVGSNVGNGTLLQDDVASLSADNDKTYTEYTPVSTDTSGGSALAAWIMAQYDAGAVAGDYIFLRLNNDKFAISYWSIKSADNTATNEIPMLTLELDVPVGNTMFISTESAGSDALKLIFNTGSNLSSLSLVGRADLTGGSWNYVPHSDNSGGPFALGDLSNAIPEGTNHAIYVETTGPGNFFYGIE